MQPHHFQHHQRATSKALHIFNSLSVLLSRPERQPPRAPWMRRPSPTRKPKMADAASQKDNVTIHPFHCSLDSRLFRAVFSQKKAFVEDTTASSYCLEWSAMLCGATWTHPVIAKGPCPVGFEDRCFEVQNTAGEPNTTVQRRKPDASWADRFH